MPESIQWILDKLPEWENKEEVRKTLEKAVKAGVTEIGKTSCDDLPIEQFGHNTVWGKFKDELLCMSHLEGCLVNITIRQNYGLTLDQICEKLPALTREEIEEEIYDENIRTVKLHRTNEPYEVVLFFQADTKFTI